MDPKQARALRDGTTSLADQPRGTDIDSVREQAENPPVSERPRPRRRTAAVADVRVNQESGTPCGFKPTTDPQMAPRDVPKSRDDRSAPKGNITAGQDDRNPNLGTRDDQRPGPPSRAFSLDSARDAAAMPNAAPGQRPIAEAKRAGSTASRAALTKSTAAKRTLRGTTRVGAARAGTNSPKAKRTVTKRAAPKHAMTRRAAPKRATKKRPTAKNAKRGRRR